MINSMIIDENDNVIVAIEAIKKGSQIKWRSKDNNRYGRY